MGKWEIAKEFNLDYGHRVWSQVVDNELSCNHSCVCRHLHGHRGTIMVYLEGDVLDNQGMVTDFHNLNWFKKFLDEVIDHKFIMDIEDPLLPDEVPFIYGTDGNINLIDGYLVEHEEGYYTIPMDILEGLPLHLIEKYEGFVLVPFVPTSENLSKWLHGIVQKRMDKLGVKVSRIQFYETPKSQSNFII